jgi:tetrapyrrole methylase family protein / MazG family protein
MVPNRVACPRIDVVGLGPAGPELITAETLTLIAAADAVFLRTSRHPSAGEFPGADTFDHHYERAETFDEVYRAIVGDVVAAASAGAVMPGAAPALHPTAVVYAVPGSPTVAERTVSLLREHPAVVSGEIILVVHPSVSFLDLAFARMGIDPVAAGVRLVDGESFAVEAAGQRGPLLVAQCWSTSVLSTIKLSVESAPSETATVLHHLGLPDERVFELSWDELDRSLTPDHLTSLWIPHLAAPVAAQLVQLDELVHILRQRCPWDREQTHGSLARHLLEESYEVLEAIDALAAIDGVTKTPDGAPDPAAEERAVADLEEELGDLLFQVYFHATLAAEEGRFTLADVARGVHDKLVSRHPHVFGDVTADTPEEVATNWEALKKSEKNRSSVTEGIPAALPALALTAKLQRKALAVGMVLPSVADEAVRVADGILSLGASVSDGSGLDASGEARRAVSDGEGGRADDAANVGEVLFALVNVARTLGVDPETALRARAASFRSSVEEQG